MRPSRRPSRRDGRGRARAPRAPLRGRIGGSVSCMGVAAGNSAPLADAAARRAKCAVPHVVALDGMHCRAGEMAFLSHIALLCPVDRRSPARAGGERWLARLARGFELCVRCDRASRAAGGLGEVPLRAPRSVVAGRPRSHAGRAKHSRHRPWDSLGVRVVAQAGRRCIGTQGVLRAACVAPGCARNSADAGDVSPLAEC